MRKEEFLNELKAALKGLSGDEIIKSVDFYAEMIDDAVENGESEEAAVIRLGSAQDIAQKIINETPLRTLVREKVKTEKAKNGRLSASAIVLIIIISPVWLSLLTAAFATVLSLYLVLWAVAASFFITFAALFLAGFALAAASPFILAAAQGAKALLCLGAGLVCMGISVFVFYLSVIISKLIIKLTVYATRKIKRSFIQGGIIL